MSKVLAGAAFGDCLENLRKPRKKEYIWSFVKIALKYKKNSQKKSSVLSFKRVKSRGSLARNALFDASKSQSERFSRFVWQRVKIRALFSRGRRDTFCSCILLFVAGAAFCDVARVDSKIVAGTAFCDVFEKWRKHHKSHTF